MATQLTGTRVVARTSPDLEVNLSRQREREAAGAELGWTRLGLGAVAPSELSMWGLFTLGAEARAVRDSVRTARPAAEGSPSTEPGPGLAAPYSRWLHGSGL